MALSKGAKIGIGVALGCVGLSVVGVVVAGVAGALFVGRKAEQAQEVTARLDSQTVTQGLELYRLKSGRYPTTAEGLEVLERERMIERLPLDPWGRPYLYKLEGDTPVVTSAGPDGQPGTTDDVGGPGR